MCRAIQKTSVIHTVPALVFFCLLNRSVEIPADEKKLVELDKITTLSNEYPAVKLDEAFSETRFGRETIEERQFKAVQDVADAVPNLETAISRVINPQPGTKIWIMSISTIHSLMQVGSNTGQ